MRCFRLMAVLSLLVVPTGAGAASPTQTALVAQRHASLEAVRRHAHAHPTHVCPGTDGEWMDDVLAFPAGRADRLYIFNLGAAWGYRVQSGAARLVWCGQAVQTPVAQTHVAQAPAGGGRPALGIPRALGTPLRTTAGTLPREGALDVYRSRGGRLETLKFSAGGRVMCRRTAGPGTPRSAQQFDDRDVCP